MSTSGPHGSNPHVMYLYLYVTEEKGKRKGKVWVLIGVHDAGRGEVFEGLLSVHSS